MPQAKTIIVKPRGLYDTSNNPWNAPDGAMTSALNLDMVNPGVLKPRPGMSAYISSPYAYVFLAQYGDYIVGRRSTGTLAYTSTGSGWADYAGSFPTLTAAAQSARSLFIPTSAGTYVLDSITGPPVKAGVAPGLDIAATVAGVGTAVQNNTKVAYRAVFGRRDANGRLLLGAPSSRAVLTNTAGSTQNVTVVVTLPADVQNSTHFVQLYRTAASVDQNTDPGDECYLVYEAALSAVSTVSITDSTPDGLGGASLYTNPSQQSILNSNAEPPLAYDLAEFGGALWYADVTFPARQTINLLGVSGTNGLALNDTITVNGQVFTAKAAETVASREFLLATAGTVDENVRATAASLIKCINRTSSANAYAIDISEPAPFGIPGAIDIRRNDRTSNLTLAVSRATAWANIVATTVPVRTKNGLVFSKDGQPDQVSVALASAPLLVGTGSEEIQRIIPTRNSLWVLKQDGIWRVTGSGGAFDVQPFDPTVKIIAKKSAVALDNQAYFLSDQGVVRVSETGVELISDSINGYLSIPYQSASGTSGAVAVGRERRGQYVIWGASISARTAFVYNIRADAWTNRDEAYMGSFTPAAATEFGDYARLMVAGTSVDGLAIENDPSLGGGFYHSDSNALIPKTLASPTPVVNSDGTVTLTFGSPVSGVSVNDQISQATSFALGRVKSVGSNSITVTPNKYLSSPSFTSDTITVYAGIPVVAGFFVRSPDPGASCEWQEAVWLWGSSGGGLSGYYGNISGTSIYGSALFSTDNGQSSVSVIRPPLGVTSQVASVTRANAPLVFGGQFRVAPGRAASFGPTIEVAYYETAAYALIPDTIVGLVLKFVPGGDGASR